MPYISLKTNTAIPEQTGKNLEKRLGQAISLIPGKSEKWLMLSLEGSVCMAFAGREDPCCMVQVDTYGKVEDRDASALTSSICTMVQEELHVGPDRTYVAYRSTGQWGWNGENF